MSIFLLLKKFNRYILHIVSHTQTIKIKSLEVLAKHGVFEKEKQIEQRFIIDCDIFLFRDTALDSVDATIDYVAVGKLIKNYSKKHCFDLIETLADKLCLEILVKFPKSQQVKILIKKPDAELPFKASFVAVEQTRKRQSNVFLGLGSNLGDREKAINFALNSLSNHPHCTVKKSSPIFETVPYGVTSQPDFLNSCVELETFLSPFELLALLKKLEKDYGRQANSKRWSARELDIDLLFYGDLILNSATLNIPHPDLINRRFVLAPLCAIAPLFYHPTQGRDIGFLLSTLKD